MRGLEYLERTVAELIIEAEEAEQSSKDISIYVSSKANVLFKDIKSALLQCESRQNTLEESLLIHEKRDRLLILERALLDNKEAQQEIVLKYKQLLRNHPTDTSIIEQQVPPSSDHSTDAQGAVAHPMPPTIPGGPTKKELIKIADELLKGGRLSLLHQRFVLAYKFRVQGVPWSTVYERLPGASGLSKNRLTQEGNYHAWARKGEIICRKHATQ